MNKMNIYDSLCSLEAEVLQNEPLSSHCSFKIGGPAEILFTPKTEEALIEAVRWAKVHSIPLHILGNGSNLLISDRGVKGIVLKLMGGLTALYETEDGEIFCASGVSLKRLCDCALEKELTGLEFAYGIPGSLGGAIYMNAGAYGGEIKDVLTKVRTLDPKTLEIKETETKDLDLSYRHTPFMETGEVILGGYFRLNQGEAEAIKEKMNELMGRRKASQPLSFPSAGSTFKRPAGGYAAAMIDECALKGFAVGGAEVSTKHAGFVINKNNASFSDVMGVIEGVRAKVLAEKGVFLETEVEIWEET